MTIMGCQPDRVTVQESVLLPKRSSQKFSQALFRIDSIMWLCVAIRKILMITGIAWGNSLVMANSGSSANKGVCMLAGPRVWRLQTEN